MVKQILTYSSKIQAAPTTIIDLEDSAFEVILNKSFLSLNRISYFTMCITSTELFGITNGIIRAPPT